MLKYLTGVAALALAASTVSADPGSGKPVLAEHTPEVQHSAELGGLGGERGNSRVVGRGVHAILTLGSIRA